jgi:DNA polymerase V
MPIPCGHPFPVEDAQIEWLDMNEYLIRNSAETHYLYVTGESMKDLGIHSGDVIVVDRALEPFENCIAVVDVDGDFTVKTFSHVGGKLWLVPANADFKAIRIQKGQTCAVWASSLPLCINSINNPN